MNRRARLITIPLLCLLVGAPPVLAGPVSPFTGAWTSVDVDGSTQYLSISGGAAVHATLTDLSGTVCARAAAPTMVFNGQLTGTVACDSLDLTWVRARCGAASIDFLIGFTGTWTYDPQHDTLSDGVVTWTRR